MAIKAVVFDIGGVLEITPPTGWDARWEKRLGLEPGELPKKLSTEWRGGSIGTVCAEDVARGTREKLGLSQEQLDEFMGDLWDDYLGTLNTELAAYFAGLRPRYKTGILSNSFVGAREKEQERYGFGDMCDLIVYSHEVGMKKPDRRIYELLCERLGLPPGEVLFVDDVPQAVEAAREAGIHAIRFQDNKQTIAEIEAYLQNAGQQA